MSRDLKSLLDNNDLGGCYDRLIAEDVDMDVFAALTEEDLKELGFSLGERKRLVKAQANAAAADTPSDTQAERRNLTVAFCDLVGSTPLAATLDPEDLRSVISAYLDTTVETMKSFGGHLAYTQGDGVMIYFGYPVAGEEDAAQAIRAALATIDAVGALQTAAPEPLAMRIGIATGVVVVGDMANETTAPKDFVVGETPNFAARLQSLSETNEVLVSRSTSKLAASAFEFTSRGVTQIKGFDEPREIFAVAGERTTKSRFDARSDASLRPILGRDAELSALSAMWDDCASGMGSIALIEGAAGIGKSRLIRSLYDMASAPSLEWQCAPHLSNRTLHSIIGELERAAGIVRGDTSEGRRSKTDALVTQGGGLLNEDRITLANLLGATAEDEAPIDALALARRSREMIIRRVVSTTSNGPAIAILEDAHWADPMTLDLLETLCDRISAVPLLLLVTFRPEFTPSPTLQEAATHIRLTSLPDSESRALMDNISGNQPLPDALARRVLAKADGVPLYIEEMTRAVLEPFLDPFAAHPDTLDDIAVPATLQDSLMARLDRMGPAKEIAQLGAMIGREFTLPMVAALAPDGTDVNSALMQLDEAGILYRGGLMGPDAYVFNHALVQDTAYESMLRSRRQSLHKTLAEAMIAQHPAFGVQEPEIIARHCEIGGLTDAAITHWTRAGQEALGRAANLSAVAHLGAALRLLEATAEGPARDGTELGLQMMMMPAAMSIYGWGAPEVEAAAFRARDLAGQLQDGTALYGATWGVWTMHFLRGEMGECFAASQQVDAMAQAVGGPMLLTTADHAVGYSQFWMGDLKPVVERYRAGIARYDPEIEQQIIATFQLGSTLNISVFGSGALWLLGHTEEGQAAIDKLIPFAEGLNHNPSLAYGLGGVGQTMALQQDWEGLLQVAERNYHLSQEEGYILWQTVADVQRAVARGALGGEPEQALAQIASAREMFLATGSRVTDTIYFPAIGDLMIRCGRAQDALDLAQDGLAQAEARLEKLQLAELFRMRGRAHQALGDMDAARTDFETARATAQAQGTVPFIARADADLVTLNDLNRTSTV